MIDFINEIYQKAIIIEGLKEYVYLVDSGFPLAARDVYNKTSLSLERLLEQISTSDTALALKLQSVALDIKQNYEDQCLAKGLVQDRLIPDLYLYIQQFTGIDVTEGKYSLKSSSTGFLTVYDNDLHMHMHDTYDPMYEAYQTARSIYKPQMEEFLILGCGLGYLAFQIYEQSSGAVTIYIYEEDMAMLNYAYDFGVLSLIPEDILKVVQYDDREMLAADFIAKINDNDAVGYTISPWKSNAYAGTCNHELNRIDVNNSFNLQIRDLAPINLWKNRKLKNVALHEIISLFDYTEWVVLSAGPSFDESIPFIKESKGKRGIIAVNTVLIRLVKEGILPDIVASADQFNEQIGHIETVADSTRDIPLIADWLVNWKYSSLYQGPICFVRTNASAKITEAFVPNENIWDISGTVSCLAVEAAVNLKAKTIYLVGQDLAYPGKQMYAQGMPYPEMNKDIIRDIQIPSVDGGMVDSCEAFIWFKKSLEYQIAKYSDVRFINMSRHGALITGTYPPDN